jgi:hypothetical protein
MEGGLSDRALKVLRAMLHEKVGMDLDEMPDPALVADQISLVELACLRNCGGVTVAEIRDWVRRLGYELRFARQQARRLPVDSRRAIGLNSRAPLGHST